MLVVVTDPAAAARAAFEAHQEELLAVTYRMVGVPAVAEDLVSETFTRLLERPPPDLSTSLRPWLFRVSLNLARDHLRARKKQAYEGPWLPAPMPEPPCPQADPEAHYGMAESATLAFLHALEDLTENQRAVLLLRDVFEFSVRECAELLELSESNVKTTHHRARKAMAGYEEHRCRPDPQLRQRTAQVLQQMAACLMGGDVEGFRELLAADVVLYGDGGGEFFAARVPVAGADKVARFYGNLARANAARATVEVQSLSGLPSFVTRIADRDPRNAPVSCQQVVLDDDGKIVRIYSVLATAKVRAVVESLA